MAIDIMLLLESKTIEHMQKGAYPFTLTFFKERQEKLWRYDICIAVPGKEALLCAALEQIGHKYRMIVIVLDSSEQQKNSYFRANIALHGRKTESTNSINEKRLMQNGF